MRDARGANDVSPLALSLKSLRNRRFTVGLTVASIALSVALHLWTQRLFKPAEGDPVTS